MNEIPETLNALISKADGSVAQIRLTAIKPPRSGVRTIRITVSPWTFEAYPPPCIGKCKRHCRA